jgi:uncharacterized protein YeaO (DUF488 family)
MISIERVYGSKSKGFRILVDRVWPRGLKKESVNANLWIKDVAPSDELRKWFGHDESKWEEFRKKYKKELKTKPQVERLREIKDLERKNKNITLLFGAKDEKHNQAVVLKEVLDSLR